MSVTKIITKLTSIGTSVDNMEELGKDGNATNSKTITDMMMGSKKAANNKAVNGRRRFGENGFEEGGGYMAVKKAKLDNQFNASVRGMYKKDESMNTAEIFKGISVWINGYTDPPESELREIFILHGGMFHPYNSSKTTYVVATNLSAPSKRLYGAKTITPNWIMDSIAAGKPLDTRKYMLYNFNQERNQMTLTQIMGSKKAVAETPSLIEKANGHVNGHTSSSTIGMNGKDDEDKDRVSESEDEFFECSQESPVVPKRSISTSSKCNGSANAGVDSSDIFEKSFEECSNVAPLPMSPDIIDLPSSNESVKECTPQVKISEMSVTSPVTPTKMRNESRIKTATDDGFLEDFFGRSRLHLISEQKKDMQLFVQNLRKNIDTHEFPNLKKFEEEYKDNYSPDLMSSFHNEVVLMHVDMDCFFVSVGLLKRPHLRGKPVVVTHSTGKGQDSRSDIACASYEARKYGVRNGMWVGEAKAMCPELEVIPYDFDEYRRVSKLFYEAVASVTLDVEACSVDEMVIDATSTLKKVPGATPEELAQFLRNIIKACTNCPASVGIGSNRLLAKLAVKLAKPDGAHYLKDVDAQEYIYGLQVRDLPGVGNSNEGKLRELNVITCGDLLRVPLRELKSVFGEKTAEKMQNLCRGKDTAEIKIGLDRPKSLSVDVNFGIRFTKESEVSEFLMKVCKELSSRAEKVQALSKNFTLKLLTRKKGAGEPMKQGGHGIVDSVSRSKNLMNPTRSWQEFYKIALTLTRALRVPATEYRGVGVTLSDLTFEGDKTCKRSVQRTLTDMPISRGQKMLSIINQQKKSKANITETANQYFSADNQIRESHIDSDTDSDTLMEIPDNNDTSKAVPDREHSSTNTTSKLINAQENEAGSNHLNPFSAKAKENTNSNGIDLSKLPVDIVMLRQLPRDIAEEQCQLYGISKELLDEDETTTGNGSNSDGENGNNGTTAKVDNYYDNVETVDQSFLLALPENVRQDVLIQLQEAKGRRTTTEINTVFDDQQPCSSKQALERSRKLELERKKEIERNERKNEFDFDDPEQLSEQITPIIDYSNNNKKSRNWNAKQFWDTKVKFVVVPSVPATRPGLNNAVEVSDVRDLIREGLKQVKNPIQEEIDNLEKYFITLLTEGWLDQTEMLLKFIHRQANQLGDQSKWTPVLEGIIQKTQEKCRKLYQSEFDLD